jgi:uncharacterized membrane protein YhhN
MHFWILYFVNGLIFLIFQLVENHSIGLLISKSLIMPLLFLVWYKNGGLQTKIGKPICAAIFFSWIGDLVLAFSDRGILYFAFGLSAFLIAHVFYIFSFRKEQMGENRISLIGKNPWLVWPFIILLFGLLYLYWNNLGVLKIPVTIYASCILTMLAAALNRYSFASNASWKLVLVGATLFVISDATIGFNKFVNPFGLARLFIMSTYIVGQAFIIGGLLKNKSLKNGI